MKMFLIKEYWKFIFRSYILRDYKGWGEEELKKSHYYKEQLIDLLY